MERKCCPIKLKKITARPALALSGLAVLLLFFMSVEKNVEYAGASLDQVIMRGIAEEFGDSLYQSFFPAFSFVREKNAGGGFFHQQIVSIMPLYGYSLEQEQERLMEDEYISLEEILLAEGREGSHEQSSEESKEKGLAEQLLAENAAAAQVSREPLEFVPRTLQTPINPEELQSYETLVSRFYAIDANTMAGSDQLDVNKLLSVDLALSGEREGPQILIYHTHSQEAFADSVPGDVSTSIVGMGDLLTQILTEEYGYQVLHHTGQYDAETRDDAYSKSLPAIEQLLADNPSIQVVIDLHRDQMPAERRLVMDLDGRPTAQFMFFNGLSRTRKTGDISYLYNENQEANLAFSFQMQLKAAEYYPGLTRKIYLKGYRYNMHLMPRTLLIELGAQNNTVEEVKNACDPLAHILNMVLSGERD